MQTITWNGHTIQTDYHASPPAKSDPEANMWLPGNVQVLGNGNLQLSLQQNSGQYYYNDQGEKIEIWASSEAVFQDALKYGTYYCTFKVTDGSGNPAWEQFAMSNTAPPALNMTTTFGIFLFDPTSSSNPNPHAEIDIIELGYQGQPNDGTGWIAKQPGGPVTNNAQFALQPWDAGSPNSPNFDMVHRIAVDVSKITTNEVTVKMTWTAGGAPVSYSLAYGAYDSSNFPPSGTIDYTTPASVDGYVPGLSQGMQLHMNLWPYGGPSTGDPVFVEISNLELP